MCVRWTLFSKHFIWSLQCRGKFVFILPGLSAVKIFIVDVFSLDETKLTFLLFMCVAYIYEFEWWTLFIHCMSAMSVNQPTQSSDSTFQNKSPVVQLDPKHCNNKRNVVLLLWRTLAKEEVLLRRLLPWRKLASIPSTFSFAEFQLEYFHCVLCAGNFCIKLWQGPTTATSSSS